jgi:hypothetical protein
MACNGGQIWVTAIDLTALSTTSNNTTMARRFHNVLRGYRGEAAKAKFLDHLKGLGQGENIGTKGPRPASKILYIQPFGQDLGANLYLQVSALEPSYTALAAYSEVSSRVKIIIGSTETSVRIAGITAARVVRRQKDATGTVTPSKLTGLKYMKYKTPSVSAPVGRKSPTDKEGEMIDDIRAQILAPYSLSFVDERL